MLAGIVVATQDTPAELLRMHTEIAAVGSSLRGVDEALPQMRDAVATLGPLLTSKAEETNTRLARMERSIVSSILDHQALLADAISAADERHAAHERNLLGRLVSVPSALKELSDELVPSRIPTRGGNVLIARDEQLQGLASSLTTSHSGCLCRARQNYQGNKSQWGPLRFYNESLVKEHHLPGCPRRRFIKDRRTCKQTYGITYTGLLSIMNRAIDCSFSMCFGAGGWSISPEFRCISTVDSSKAPAFRLISVLVASAIFSNRPLEVGNTDNLVLTIFDWKKLLNSILDKISWLFENRLGRPDDVDGTNQTILFYVMTMVWINFSQGCISYKVTSAKKSSDSLRGSWTNQ